MIDDGYPLLFTADALGAPSGWPQVVKGITLHQPYPTLILGGHKRWETRGRRVNYTGPVMLHAAATDVTWWKIWHEGHQRAYCPEATIVSVLAPLELDIVDDEPVPFGRVVGSMVLGGSEPILGEFDPAPKTGGYFRRTNNLHYFPAEGPIEDVTDQLPFGIWEPGRHAVRLLLVEAAETRCPVCWRTGNLAGRLYSTGPGWDGTNAPRCPVCKGLGHCQPFRLRGNQATPWNWTPKEPAP